MTLKTAVMAACKIQLCHHRNKLHLKNILNKNSYFKMQSYFTILLSSFFLNAALVNEYKRLLSKNTVNVGDPEFVTTVVHSKHTL